MARAGGTNLSLAFLLVLTSSGLFPRLAGVSSKVPGPFKHFVFAFLIALVLYAVAYSYIENRRTRKGPWRVIFTIVTDGQSTLTINQPWLNLSNVVVTFPGANPAPAPTNETIDFRVPKDVPFDVPFGTCIFEDTTFLPGTIVFKMFGHKIQLIPRVLTVDGKEYPWKSDSTLNVRDAQ